MNELQAWQALTDLGSKHGFVLWGGGDGQVSLIFEKPLASPALWDQLRVIGADMDAVARESAWAPLPGRFAAPDALGTMSSLCALSLYFLL
jgi:hypothetical protein